MVNGRMKSPVKALRGDGPGGEDEARRAPACPSFQTIDRVPRGTVVRVRAEGPKSGFVITGRIDPAGQVVPHEVLVGPGEAFTADQRLHAITFTTQFTGKATTVVLVVEVDAAPELGVRCTVSGKKGDPVVVTTFNVVTRGRVAP